MKLRIRRPSPAMLVALFALIIGMSGSAYAIQRGTQSGDLLITKRTLSGDRLRLNTVTGKEVADLVWHNLILVNGWQNYHDPGVRTPAWTMDAQGIVHLRGAIQQSTGSTTKFARLPVASRPSDFVYLSTDMQMAATGRVYISGAGDMYADAALDQASAQQFTSLDGLTFIP